MKKKVAVIGAGQVGATTAQRLIEKDLCDVVLFDIVEGLAKGKALDLMEAAPIEGHTCHVSGTNSYTDIAGADIVVITAGFPRKPGMSREDLLIANAKIIRSVAESVKQHAPQALIITVTNPLDIMTQLVLNITGFERSRVMGMAGVLDSARMRYFIAEKLKCVPRSVESLVLGGHGDLMVPVMSHVKVDGKPVKLSAADQQAIIKRTQQGGAEIVALLKQGSAFYAPASSVAAMVGSIIHDEHAIHPVCAYCRGEYGLQDVYSGVPAKLGATGIESIVEVSLSKSEAQALKISADKVRKGVAELAALKY